MDNVMQYLKGKKMVHNNMISWFVWGSRVLNLCMYSLECIVGFILPAWPLKCKLPMSKQPGDQRL